MLPINESLINFQPINTQPLCVASGHLITFLVFILTGFEWSEESFIYDDGPVKDGDNLGAILVDDETATIFLFYTLCPHHVNCTISSMMYTTSVDDGITWKKSVNLSAIIQGEGHSFAFGPGRGIQVKVVQTCRNQFYL